MKALVLHFLKEMQNKGSLKFTENHPLSLVSTFGIGGEAGVFVRPLTAMALVGVLQLTYGRIPLKLIGNASNLLFCDKGFCGAVVSTSLIGECAVITEPKTATELAVFEATGAKKLLFAACGCALPQLCRTSQLNGITGFEGLCSIPATVGGAIACNAGAFGHQISDRLLACELYLPRCGEKTLRFMQKSDFSYRRSAIRNEGAVVLGAYFSAESERSDVILSRMQNNKALRAERQPKGVRSAGSYFKKPNECEGYPAYRGKSAGELIELCGLKGFSVGGASVSEKHANFLINTNGTATARDVLTLAARVKKAVWKKTGICLSEEVEYVPFDPFRSHP